MVSVKIVPATLDHIVEINKKVRREDRNELWVAAMQTPLDAMQMGIECGKTMTGLVDGEPVVMWGVVEDSLMLKTGMPWMLATTELESHAMQFLRRCKKHVMEMLREYGTLENYVDARNIRAIQWLKWLGFTVSDKAEPYGVFGLPFHKFNMEV